mgnify:CR=1 FL=1
MMSIKKFLATWGIRAALLPLLLTGTLVTADEPPPFEFIAIKGGVKSGNPEKPNQTYLNFHAKLRPNAEFGEGFAALCEEDECGLPDVAFNTMLYLPMLMQRLQIKVAGNCFKGSKEGYHFKMHPKDPDDCVTASLSVETEYPSVDLFDGINVEDQDLKYLLKDMNVRVRLVGRGRQTRAVPAATLLLPYFEVGAYAEFDNPIFPYPVAGFGGREGPASGNEVCIGDRCGFAPFEDISFQGRAGKDICENTKVPKCRDSFFKDNDE